MTNEVGTTATIHPVAALLFTYKDPARGRDPDGRGSMHAGRGFAYAYIGITGGV